MKKNYKETRIEVEGRTFQIEFWEEPWYSIELHYVCVSEIILKEVKPHWFSRKTVMREVKHEIQKTWGASNRVEWAMDRIKSHLRYEKEKFADCQQVEDFCKENAR